MINLRSSSDSNKERKGITLIERKTRGSSSKKWADTSKNSQSPKKKKPTKKKSLKRKTSDHLSSHYLSLYGLWDEEEAIEHMYKAHSWDVSEG